MSMHINAYGGYALAWSYGCMEIFVSNVCSVVFPWSNLHGSTPRGILSSG